MGSGSGLFRCLTAFPAARKRVRHPSGARPFCCSLTRRVRELRPGERLLLASGQEATVKAARCEAAARDGLGRALQTPVYNFQVKGWHSYFAAPNEGATLGEFAWVHNAKYSQSPGRSGKQARLRELSKDPNVAKRDKGWIKQDMNQIKRGKRTSIRVPPGKNLAHRKGQRAAQGSSYKHSDLQDIDLHKLEHKYEGY